MPETRDLIARRLAPQPAIAIDSPVLARARAAARTYVGKAHAANTTRAYEAAWTCFQRWCAQAHVEPDLYPELVALFLAAEAEHLAVSTLRLRLSALVSRARATRQRLDRTHPVLQAVMAGIARTKGAPPRRVRPLLAPDLAAFCQDDPRDARACRDQAILLLGFAGALRRSELVGLDLPDAAISTTACTLTIRSSKTDPYAIGNQVRILRQRSGPCPVKSLEAWLARRGTHPGPLFSAISKTGRILRRRLCDRTVARLIKAAVARLGLDPTLYSGHSLRAGLATAADARGISLADIQKHTRHRSLDQLAVYLRRASCDVTADILDSAESAPPQRE